MKQDIKYMKEDIKIIKVLNERMFEQQLGKHVERTLGFISLAYENLKFSPLDTGPFHLESYLASTLSVSREHTLGKDNKFDWLIDYKHANYKGKFIKVESYNFNLVTSPLYNINGESGPHIVIGDVKVEGSIFHLAKGLLKCAHLAGLVMENARQVTIRHPDLNKDPRLNVSFFLFVICGYFNEFPKGLKGKVTIDKLNKINLAASLKLNEEDIKMEPLDVKAGVSGLWNCFALSKYQNKTLSQMYAASSPNFDIINSFAMYLLLLLLLAWEKYTGPHIDIGFIEGKL